MMNTKMQDLIKLVMEFERKSGEFYRKAATVFSDDTKLQHFLLQLAEEEALHYHIMASALEHQRCLPDTVPAIDIDKQLETEIKDMFGKLPDILNHGELSEEDLLGFIADIEFSEWNYLFLYVVGSLKETVEEFQYVPPIIQNHKRKIEYYFETYSKGREYLTKLKDLEPIWKENILIVDDEEIVANLYKAILKKEGHVSIASNGQAALNQLKKHYYKLIISDIDMDVMDGISFYKNAAKLYPGINNRFLFTSGDITGDRADFLSTNEISYLGKPASVSKIKENALHILLQTQGDRRELVRPNVC